MFGTDYLVVLNGLKKAGLDRSVTYRRPEGYVKARPLVTGKKADDVCSGVPSFDALSDGSLTCLQSRRFFRL